ncbi:Uncharacterised protein [Burkholderia pseudomallei]|nr:Uncharacterised protein [Burkholderia pseudomallei]
MRRRDGIKMRTREGVRKRGLDEPLAHARAARQRGFAAGIATYAGSLSCHRRSSAVTTYR